ncbi:hypothetical protein [Candidatus Poriferisocius sp.]|uniref:hypothetical protein n=1 Tax=Candidatus Poriferisocius sp. TaxID=3101276 RepID=UPI003B5A0A87
MDDQPEAEFSTEGVKLLDHTVEVSRRQTQTQAGDLAVRARRLAEELRETVDALGSPPSADETGAVAELLEKACRQADEMAELFQDARTQAEAEVEHGRAQGREIVEQAKALRLTVLRDMAKRRQAARAQVERLRAGRDKLLATLGEVRNSIDQSMESAKLSLAEAKVMADAAARRVEEEPDTPDVALLSELDDAQELGIVAPEAPVDHPVLAGAEDSGAVDAIFARLRSQDDPTPEDRETAPGAAKVPTGKG